MIMKRNVKNITFLIILLCVAGALFTGCSGCSKNVIKRDTSSRENGSIDSYITDTMRANHIAGLAACIVKNREIVWIGTYGYANIEKKIPVNKDTLFKLASVCKTITAAALMQMFEQGKFGLDNDINNYLPFSVRNPAYPSIPITFRMLLTHTSSMRDNWEVMTYYKGRDSSIPLSEYMLNYLTPGGKYYYPEKSFYSTVAPGAGWKYCNNAFVLVAYLVEVITGIPFDQYCEKNIFTPLGMKETSWFLSELDRDKIAMPYKYDGKKKKYVPYGYFGYSDWPAGQLRTTVKELAAFLITHMQKGRYGDIRILNNTTVDLMLSIQSDLNSTQGLVWFYNNHRWGHGGADLGVCTRIAFNPSENTGVIVLTNSEARGTVARILDKLFSYAADM